MTETDIQSVLIHVRNEFTEMPGLRLSMSQAMRLWGLDRDACERVVDALVHASFLRRTSRGDVVRSA
jgi:hypothetical protein